MLISEINILLFSVPQNLPAPMKLTLPKLESISRIGSIPLVESSLEMGEKLYAKIKVNFFYIIYFDHKKIFRLFKLKVFDDIIYNFKIKFNII